MLWVSYVQKWLFISESTPVTEIHSLLQMTSALLLSASTQWGMSFDPLWNNSHISPVSKWLDFGWRIIASGAWVPFRMSCGVLSNSVITWENEFTLKPIILDFLLLWEGVIANSLWPFLPFLSPTIRPYVATHNQPFWWLLGCRVVVSVCHWVVLSESLLSLLPSFLIPLYYLFFYVTDFPQIIGI